MDDEGRSRVRQNILKFGQHIMAIGLSEGDPEGFLPFVYTIGNYEAGLPELLLIGNSGAMRGRILNILGDIQRKRRTPFEVGERVDFTAKLPARIIDGGQRALDDYVVQACVYYGRWDIPVREVLLPDQNGIYPGEVGCEPPYSLQPLLTLMH